MRESLGSGSFEPSKADEQLQEEVSRRLHADRSLEMLPFEVIVKDGVVTLTGRVRTAELRQRAEALAAGISGVRRVENRIVVAEQPA